MEILSKIASINDGLETLYFDKKRLSSSLAGQWKDDAQLKGILSTFKSVADNLSGYATKLAMIATQFRSEEAISSISLEIGQQIDQLYSCFLLFTGCSVGWPLMEAVSKLIRAYIAHYGKLFELIINEADAQTIRSATGVIWKICDDVKKIPLSNKAAYRRDIMEKITACKDTLREFKQYVEDFNANSVNGNGISITDKASDDDSDSGDLDDESIDQYSASDIAVVDQCLELIESSVDFLNLNLHAMTIIGDFSSVLSSAILGDAPHVYYYSWISTVSDLCSKIETSITNLGAELYPPLDDSATIAAHFSELAGHLRVAKSALSDEIIAVVLSTAGINFVEQLELLLNSPKLEASLVF